MSAEFDEISKKFNGESWVEHVRFRRSQDVHVSWYVHLFYADLVASLLRRELLSCFKSPFGLTPESRTIKDLQSINATAPMQQNLQSCREDVEPILLVSASSFLEPRVQNANNSSHDAAVFTSKPPSSWKLGDEGRGRGGWIDSVPLPMPNNLPDSKYFSSISIALPALVKTSGKIQEIQVLIEYLKSYENAGAAYVVLCGRDIGIIDALWKDYSQYRWSFPSFVAFRVQKDILAECNSLQTSTLEIRHMTLRGIEWENGQRENLDLVTDAKVRGAHKIRLISIKICQ